MRDCKHWSPSEEELNSEVSAAWLYMLIPDLCLLTQSVCDVVPWLQDARRSCCKLQHRAATVDGALGCTGASSDRRSCGRGVGAAAA